MPRDSEKELDAVLIGLVGRRLTRGQVYNALEMSRSTYHRHRIEGRLITADNLIRAANNLGINPVDLLVHYNLLTPEDSSRPRMSRNMSRRRARRATHCGRGSSRPATPGRDDGPTR